MDPRTARASTHNSTAVEWISQSFMPFCTYRGLIQVLLYSGFHLNFLSAMSSSAGGTTILDRDLLLKGLEDQPWFEKNIPLLEIPDKQIQEVYYYRWQTYKEHLVYTGAEYGYMASEFLSPVSYGAPYGGIVAAAGHHITEGRWIRDTRYGQDIAKYWLAGPGQFPKPMRDDVNKDTSDWAHEYSFWAATALWKQYLVTGDKDFVVGQLTNLVKQYRGWDNHYSSSLGLYWQVPVWDATEYTAASYESSDPYPGGAGFRPTINSYQYGDAIAIAKISALGGDSDLENEYRREAESLQVAVQKHLWDNESKFYKHRARDDNSSGSLLGTREIMGYLPWAFDMPCDESQLDAFSQLKDPQGFFSKFGPTTAERRSKWFMYEADNCCRWDGPSWPFSTSQTLTAVENVLHDYSIQNYITPQDYYEILQRYARIQYKDGRPYVAEAHHPDEDKWMYDGYNHSEDYNHSTFVDNVLAGLIGLRAQSGETIVVNPLTPSNWDYFAVEDVAYHGLLSLSYGTRQVQSTTKSARPSASLAFASYTSAVDDPMRAINGMVFRTEIPQNSRWTSYNSLNSKDHFGVDLRKVEAVDNVRLFFYDDSDGVRIPASYDLQYWTGDAWATIPDQVRSPMPISSNAETKIEFPSISTSRIILNALDMSENIADGIASGSTSLSVASSTADLKRKRENSTASLAIPPEPSVSFHVGSELRQTPQSSFLSYVWGTGLDSDCVSCGKQFLPDGEPPIRTIATGNSNSQPSVIDITQEPVSPWNLRIFNRHLSCIKARNVNYISISHAWHPAVATAQDLRLESTHVSRLVYQIPSRTLLALTAKSPGCEVWHDYLSVPQWRPEVQEQLLLLIPEIYNHAAETVIHLDDVGASHLSGQVKDSPYDKFIVDLAAIIRSRWFDRMWVTLEYIQSNDVLILTEDYTLSDAYARDICHQLDTAHSKWVKKRSNSIVTEDIWKQNTTLKRMTSWIDMEAWKNEHDMYRTLGWAIGILGHRKCQYARDYFLALGKMLDFRPEQDPLVLIENRFAYFFSLATYALQQGDYSPLLFIQSPGEETDPRAPWLRGYLTGTWKLWDMGRCHRKATSQPIILDGRIQPKLQTVGIIETFEYYDFGGDAESVVDYIVSKIVRASGQDPQALCDAMDRIFPRSEAKALNMEWKDAKIGDVSISTVRYDLDKVQGLLEKYGQLLDMKPGQDTSQQRLEIAKKLIRVLKLSKEGKLARESRLELAAGEADWFLREYGTPMEGISQIRFSPDELSSQSNED
ncbi:hypothetical protein FMUND_11956 [Fusarium mundagurra]|uniref:Alpha-L-rhamnosidase six-hairpin glycosidase domain-containing protein n=1 Tax=Fusarium mundagurra TaxID=1567541 RepID=A0A8H5Y4V7_9HYPO|nr:hypothetical protein FMUND_11956 [Fusarium mundagurra]